MKTKDLIAEANLLPVDERALIVDSILKSLNAPEKDIDREWAKVAKKRLSEMRSGVVKSVPGKKVFANILKNYKK
jgi:hypothetical protein